MIIQKCIVSCIIGYVLKCALMRGELQQFHFFDILENETSKCIILELMRKRCLWSSKTLNNFNLESNCQK